MKRLSQLGRRLALGSLLLLVTQVGAQENTAPLTRAEQFTLSNGMTLIVKPDRRSPTVVQMLWVRAGSMDEVDGTSGVAHVLEHMMFKGTPDLKPGEFSRRVAALGGRDNAFTAKDYTGYFQQVPANRLEQVMRLEADRFARNQWADEEFVRELEVVKEERRLRVEDSPRALMFETLMASVFLASPQRRPVVGWMSDLDAMTPDDAREFFRRWYVPANAALVVAGDVDAVQVRALAEKYYGPIPARPLPARKPREELAQSGVRRIDFKAPAEQSVVVLAFRAPSVQADELLRAGALAAAGNVGAASSGAAAAGATATDDALALTVLAAVLDGYSGARLDRALTQGENRLADSASAGFGLFGRGPQLFTLSGVPAAGKDAKLLEQALREQVRKVASEGVSEAELRRVKTGWVASEIYKLDSVMAQARELGSYWIQGLPLDGAERLIARLRQVTARQVQDVAARYFSDDQLTVATLLPQPIDKTRKPRTPPAGARH